MPAPRTANGNLAEFGGPWLLGDFSLADITMMACFHRLQDLGLEAALHDEALPHLGSYWERLQARPSHSQGVTRRHDADWCRAIEEIWGTAPSPLLGDVRRRLSAWPMRKRRSGLCSGLTAVTSTRFAGVRPAPNPELHSALLVKQNAYLGLFIRHGGAYEHFERRH